MFNAKVFVVGGLLTLATLCYKHTYVMQVGRDAEVVSKSGHTYMMSCTSKGFYAFDLTLENREPTKLPSELSYYNYAGRDLVICSGIFKS